MHCPVSPWIPKTPASPFIGSFCEQPSRAKLRPLARAGAIGRNLSGPFTNRFLEVYQVLKDELVSDSEFSFTPETRHWVSKMLDYNVPLGKLNRGLSVIDSLMLLRPADGLSDNEIFLALVLGWCIEWLQAYLLVVDDITDNSQTRRGKECWFRNPMVGMIACNDAALLRSQVKRILTKHFKNKAYYGHLLELFDQVEYQTLSGQLLDLITTPAGELDLSKYNMETYSRIVTLKTAFYSFYLPVACVLYMAGDKYHSRLNRAKQVLVEMGIYFQIQDDYLDCFGEPALIGKVGTDIEDSKCSWLIVQAMIRANPSQKKTLQENYGKHDPACVAAVKNVYSELKLQNVFAEYEDQSYSKLIQHIEKENCVELQRVLKLFLAKIHKRHK